jgi:uncharacterized protein (DUF302 family)
MKLRQGIAVLSSLVLLGACSENSNNKNIDFAGPSIEESVDSLVNAMQPFLENFEQVAVLDHHRMAAEAGVYTPAATAIIFTDPMINVTLVEKRQLIGLDLPYKILCFAETDTLNPKLAFTSAEFIQRRHNLEASTLIEYNAVMEDMIGELPKDLISFSDVSSISEGFGIIHIPSDYDYAATLSRLKEIVMSQGDTKWFAEVDYQREAITQGIKIRPTILLLFGGPAPGGKAMITSPKIGLDAFCQKLLVYEKENGEVWLAYNDIEAFANLYYSTTTKPQQMINQRLKMTFTKAVTLPEEEM